MAEVEETQTISQEKNEPQEKEEAASGESEQSTVEVTNGTTAIEEETEDAPAEEETVADAVATAEEAVAEDASEEKPKIEVKTAPADFRFPTTNQTRHCFTRYIEYHKCVAAKGEGASECDKYAKYYRSLCPSEWIERWNEERENGTFPGPL